MVQVEKLGLILSPEMKDALGRFATKNNLSMMTVVRRAIATYIKYDISTDTVGTGATRQKYASPEERYAAQKAKQTARRKLAQELIKKYEDEQRQKAIAAVEKSLKK